MHVQTCVFTDRQTSRGEFAQMDEKRDRQTDQQTDHQTDRGTWMIERADRQTGLQTAVPRTDSYTHATQHTKNEVQDVNLLTATS